MKLTQMNDELDALKDRKYDIGLGNLAKRSKTLHEKTMKFSDEDIQKAWFINKVAWQLQKFVDQMIEARIFETTDTEDEFLKKMAQNRVMKKRAAATAMRNDVDL